MYISLARKYRPKNFASVAVQSHVSNTLKGAIARGRVAHGYLLCGPRGVGKTTLARVLAMALNCERAVSQAVPGPLSSPTDPMAERAATPDAAPAAHEPGEPCGVCASCQRIWSGSANLDVVEIDAASNRGVDDARELRERAMYAPSTAERYKVYIVDEAHMLTREAWNALLKILEEPPPRVVFVFATTEPQKIAQAAAPVLSRLQRFDLKRIGPGDVRERLGAIAAAEHLEADPDALGMLARAADGSMRDALSLTDQVLALGDGRITVAHVREALGLVAEDEYLALVDLIGARAAGQVFPTVARLVDAGVDLGLFLVGFADMLRAQLAVTLGGTLPGVSDRIREALAARANRWAPGDLLRMIAAIGELEPRFRRSGQQQLLLETLLVRFALMDRTVDLEEVLRALDRPRPGGASDARGRGAGPITSQAEHRSLPDSASTGRDRARSAAPASSPPGSTGSEPGDAGSSAPRAASPTVHADVQPLPASPSAPGELLPPIELNHLVERWEEVVALVRATRPVLATALAFAAPGAVSGRGEVMLQLDEPSDVYERAITTNASDVLAAINSLFSGATRLLLRRDSRPGLAAADAPRRLTEEQARGERLMSLRRRDPTLASAIDALDLELME